MGMRPYVVRQGEYLTQLAHRLGFDADDVWQSSANAELRARRPDRETLLPGDILHVPISRPQRGPRVTPHTHNKYQARIPTVTIKLRLVDGRDGPLAGKAYRVHGLGRPYEGTTDGDGLATFSVPLQLRQVRLVLEESRREYQVMIGDMDPVDEPSGVKKRLLHLGYLSRSEIGPDDGDGPLRDALSAFQAAQQLTVTGEADQATRDALVSVHGS
jgi:hypothetical protein